MHEEVYKGGLHFGLPGAVQTVPRAEASACYALACHLQHDAVAVFYSDNETFVKSYNLGFFHCKGILNADIYEHIFNVINDKRLDITVFWMPSHLLDDPDRKREKPTPLWVAHMRKLGNHHADRLAGLAASYYQLHKDIVRPIIKNLKLVRVIQRRLYSIVCILPHRKIDRKIKKNRLVLPSIGELIELRCTHWNVQVMIF